MQPTVGAAPPLLSPRRRPLRSAEYERLVECGAFGDERLELIEGELVLVHTDCVAGRWTTVERVGRGQALSPRAFPDVRLQVSTLFED